MSFGQVDLVLQPGQQLVPVPDVVSAVLAGNAGSWHEGIGVANRIAADQDAVGRDLTQVLARLESAWSGAGADGAAARIQRIRSSAIAANRTFVHNGNELGDAASLYEGMKNQLTPMPARPNLAPGQGAAWWDQDMEFSVTAYNDTAKRNLDLYNGYVGQTQAGTGRLQYDYGQIGTYDGGDVSLVPASDPGSPAGPPSGNPHDPADGKAGARAHYGPADGPIAPGPLASGAGEDRTTTAGSAPSLAGALPPSEVGGAGRVGSSTGGSTGAGGFGGPETLGGIGLGGIGNGGVGPHGGGSIGSGSNGGGSNGSSPDSGGSNGNGSYRSRFGGGAGRLGSGAGAGGEAEGRGTGQAPGKQTGGGLGSGRSAAALTEAERAAAARGAGGPGGMAPGGRGGKKEPDEEHQRKFVLDTDALFDQEGRTIDPVTGLPVVPPTIGG
ncbi:hypothetical protein [Amycolatopsis sp. PS_44_ISF1]|uniref:hypothetical protein n=1 Tax=Amycolatopsis sp. PS_44_ISF1 TaxID=2974917 RepID=UPI0028DDD21A|nr:hypothetical protein [Amycolatopsis sp. PS_44_ISF1]MDT8910265.1 hypothetical protein [Amycolatopsis sp. PS_44_ISF1]